MQWATQPASSIKHMLRNAGIRSVLVVNRFAVPEGAPETFRDEARAALTALAERDGFVRGRFGGSLDEPGEAVMVTEWESVGAYRRALSAYDVKMHATPLLARAVPQASAFEVNLSAADGQIIETESDRAPGIGARDRETDEPTGPR